MSFNSSSVWMKCAWYLITVGFTVWLAAGENKTTPTNLNATAANAAIQAFLILGVCTYFAAVLLTYLFMFLEETAGNRAVLVTALVVAFVAAFGGLVALSIGQAINFSDRLFFSLSCAIASGVFCSMELVVINKSRVTPDEDEEADKTDKKPDEAEAKDGEKKAESS